MYLKLDKYVVKLLFVWQFYSNHKRKQQICQNVEINTFEKKKKRTIGNHPKKNKRKNITDLQKILSLMVLLQLSCIDSMF